MGKPVDVDLQEYATKDNNPTDAKVEKENKEKQDG
jgi:hypothetical protein